MSLSAWLDEPALAGDDFSAVAAGVADRPAAGALQVIGIGVFSGMPSSTRKARIASAPTSRSPAAHLCFIVLDGIHREDSVSFRDD